MFLGEVGRSRDSLCRVVYGAGSGPGGAGEDFKFQDLRFQNAERGELRARDWGFQLSGFGISKRGARMKWVCALVIELLLPKQGMEGVGFGKCFGFRRDWLWLCFGMSS